jgi:membrane protease YdiL (CAAX protease family)
MDRTTRKSAAILSAIMAVEAVPFVMTLLSSPPGVAGRLWGWHPGTAAAWVGAAAVATAYVLYARHSLPLVRQRFFDVDGLKLLVLPFAIVTGTFEELFFRKMLMDWAARAGAGALVQVAASAVIFGAAHAVWGLFGRQWRVALGAALATGVLGALLAGLYLLGGRQVAPCAWAHMLINLAIEPWLVMAAVSAGRDGWSRRGTA